ncbi:hypothetical protein FA13DRAFT_1740491 [Coprinellus micaceus]|uniref:F-box domain-containing protein n=1 Tax=Coprinellus micaceus TaxID=71717 RepID=A0A4Y7SMQ3_COPMI|nr:hypothetical protein FA13DRAFT_1740491 [Coprinellus micaceus]
MDSNHLPTVTLPEVIAQAQNILPEVLGEIFEHVLAKELKKGWINKQGRGDLIQMTLVCKWWREAALLARHLWGGIELNSWRMPTKPFRIPSKSLKLWFERAGDTRKSLAITTERVTLGPTSVDKTCWLHHILAFLKAGPPLYGLRIDCQSKVCLRALMRDLQDSSSPSWSTIRYLHWRIWNGEYYDMEDTIRTFLPTLATLPPSLSSLDLSISLPSDCHSQVTQMIAPATLNRLKSLNITFNKDLSPMVSLLEHCVNLRHLSIKQSRGEDYWDVPGIIEKDRQLLSGRSSVSFPYLQSLQLDLQPPQDVKVFLRLLRAPSVEWIQTRQDRTTKPDERYLWNSLHSLRLFTPGENRPAVQHITLFARSVPPATIPTNELHDILSDLPPSLRHLTLRNLTFDAGELLGLHKARATPTGALNGLLPSLQCLEIVDPGSKFDLSTFLELVKGGVGGKPHLGAFAALRRIVFTFSLRYQWEYKDHSFLNQYRDEATLQELETSFGIVMDLITITTWD